MKSLLLSDTHYLGDFDEILGGVFNNKKMMEQPRYLIEVDCREGFLLRHAFTFVKMQTYRGKRMGDFPLEVVALVLDKEKVDAVRRELSGIPHHIVQIEDRKSETIRKMLEESRVFEPEHTLFLDAFSDGDELFESKFGTVEFREFQEGGAEGHLMEAANRGWFPKVGESYCYPKSSPFSKVILNHFQKRKYCIRLAELKDLYELVQLEEMCWPKPLQASKERLKKRIEGNPGGQLVLETSEGVQGVIYTQKIKEINSIYQKTAETVQELNDPEGKIINIRSLNVSTDQRKQSFGGDLLEFVLQRAALIDDVSFVVGVTRCSNYPGKETISMEAYLKERGADRLLLDPVLRMHEGHGGEIRGVIPNYRPKDEANVGSGVAVVYELGLRKPRLKKLKEEEELFIEFELSAKTIGESVDEAILRLLSNCGNHNDEDKRTLYSRRKTLSKMGLESMQLLELRSALEQELSYDLYPTFFDEYRYPEAIINYYVEKKLQAYKDWVYEIEWQSTSIPEIQPLNPDRLWIVFADKGGEIAPRIKEKLHEHRQHCVIVDAGKEFKKMGDRHFEVDPLSFKDLKEVFSSIDDLNKLEGVIYLFGYEGRYGKDVAKEEAVDPTLEELEAFHKLSCGGLVTLVNVLVQLDLSTHPKLRVVTQSIVSDGTVASLGEWPQNALSKVIQEEYPALQCRYVAIDSQVSFTESCDAFFNELRNDSPEPQVALRKGQRLVPRMVRSEIEQVHIPHFDEKGSYIIAGGLRPLGLLLAQWYAAHGVKNLILLDDIGIKTSAKATLEQLKRQGVEVNSYHVNIDDYGEVQGVIEEVSRKLPPIKGLIHAAGLIDNELIIHMDWDRFKPVHRLKVSGSWNLHRLTQGCDLDHFILFSSCLPNLAPLGKANHATGNSFLDVLAHYRKKRGLPALTIDWGPWEMRHVEVRHVGEAGFTNRVEMLEIEEAFQLLEQLFYIEKPQVTAVVVKWPELRLSFLGENHLFDEIAIELGFKKVDILREYLNASQSERMHLIESYIHEQVRRVLKLKSSQKIEEEWDFKKLGMEVREITKLKNRIQFDIEEAFKLPYNFVEIHPSIHQLSHALSVKFEESLGKTTGAFMDVRKKNVAFIEPKQGTSECDFNKEILKIKENPEIDTVIILFKK